MPYVYWVQSVDNPALNKVGSAKTINGRMSGIRSYLRAKSQKPDADIQLMGSIYFESREDAYTVENMLRGFFYHKRISGEKDWLWLTLNIDTEMLDMLFKYFKTHHKGLELSLGGWGGWPINAESAFSSVLHGF
jgi:hypothetical protein